MASGELGARTVGKHLASEATGLQHTVNKLLVTKKLTPKACLTSLSPSASRPLSRRIRRRAMREKSQFEWASQPSDSDSDMVGILESSDQKFKITD